MINTWKHEVLYMKYSKKYRSILLLVVGLTLFFTIYLGLSQNNLDNQVMKNIFEQFRPIYWIICMYMMTDLLSTDYHSKTLKNNIWKTTRGVYLLSKVSLASLACLFLLLVHFVTSWAFLNVAGSGVSFTMYQPFWLLVGANLSLLFFATILAFIMTLFENESVVIGVAIGMTLVVFIIESLDGRLAMYLPTMLLITLENMRKTELVTTSFVLVSYFSLAFLLFLGTIKLIDRKDIYI
ncbi:hypothetical protein [Candidatus Enterococcus willemsii]|uniref:ABC transporter permease n=1 Tax=Candidatus Enterococcus willemsii TaxID=1857215 RepID=A0ABQ6YVS9_9ENTE|nr:hypothetical protein [Enterococcus sp. CU12B]KAF1301437.1 hypothetical protein BAU17_05795 [Enterococcus sp. CU12B]